VAASFALVALWLHPFDVRLTRHRWLKPLRTCGAMCYSLYLVQVPVIAVIRGVLVWRGVELNMLSSFVSIPLCAIPTLLVAWQFHVAIERRFMTTTSAQPVQPIKLAEAV